MYEKMEGGKRDREEEIGKMRDKHANKVRKLSRLMVPKLFRSTAPIQVQIFPLVKFEQVHFAK